ncbi:outer membrane protein assembly factor BamB family protein [Aeoliella mucimassa]|uniref:Outer membrane biogenesis protein BamB n=1 Tax=Aeoliella mucimassa TaxID=2527972 RepID=A0A518AP19_9BACT|nr:PQQ-binding-like beta-propeller repeat protein [Aeoliella mucimassa]QDU56462.1 outer membrane biogenesis protein BamB [Aeoliella mucimassa]
MSLRIFLIAWMCASMASAAEWSGFRGPQGSSTASDSTTLPDSFDTESGENIAWRCKLPGRGVSGPVVANGKVLVTASSGKERNRLHVAAIDEQTGTLLWHRQFWSTGRNHCHPSSANAAPTPATDGERLYAFYSSNDLACFDLEGNMLWFRGLTLDHPGVGNDVGMASSPVVTGDVVVVQCECQANSFVAAYDRLTGEEKWSLERPPSPNWASPVALEIETPGEGKVPAVVLQCGRNLAAYRADNGAMLWDVKISCGAIPSASGRDGVLYVPTNRGIAAVATKVDQPGDRILWTEDNLKCGNPSPIVTSDALLVVNSAGVLTSASLEDGSTDWKKRLGGRYWATPVVAGNRLYAMTDTGEAIIFDLDNEKVLAKCSLGADEQVSGSPAVVDGALFVRSHDYLWKIAQNSSE